MNCYDAILGPLASFYRRCVTGFWGAIVRPGLKSLVMAVLVLVLLPDFAGAGLPETVRGIYLPANRLTSRRLTEAIHYARLANLNAAVVHVKDPLGRLVWHSRNPIALSVGAVAGNGSVERALALFKENRIWTIAKIDVFSDDLLARNYPGVGLEDNTHGGVWQDRNGLGWTNPFDKRVWAYILDLCRELAAMGFDELQFDYVRFPSDGRLASIRYPLVQTGVSRARCIGNFLSQARDVLKPLGVVVSVDIFGLTAWKRDDFGVGQVLEEIVPFVDVICPMLYPSHFPPGFLGWKTPGDYPEKIMALSMASLKKRTSRSIRPWIQGFWYTPGQIRAQMDGAASQGESSWAVWNPSGNYSPLYQALARSMDTTFPEPVFYPALGALREKGVNLVHGSRSIVNLTDYMGGDTVLSLERPEPGSPARFASSSGVVATMDEAILDRILSMRKIAYPKLATKARKVMLVAGLLSEDTGIDPRRMDESPVHVNWNQGCVFSLRVPPALRKLLGARHHLSRKAEIP
ncbi:MAG: hypothetical protein GY737_12775 [Desulfobacteraceae bacterium]|nr:hypothetical protein [Desulfobacteraceae bacterium]